MASKREKVIKPEKRKGDDVTKKDTPVEERFVSSQKLQRNYQRRMILTNTTLILILIGVVGFLVYTSLVSTKKLSAENASIRSQLSQFVNGDPVTIYENKTFVRYDQEPLAATIYSSATCSTCAQEVEKIIAKLQASLPTLQNIIILDTDDAQVQGAALKIGVGYLPGVVFSKNITTTSFYEEGKEFFSAKSDGSQQFYTHSLGHTPIKFIATTKNLAGFPSQDSTAIAQGTKQANEASVEIHAFLTTDCPACKTARDVIKNIEQSNPAVEVVEHFAQNLQSSPHSATKAIACAYESGKGEAFTNTLFARQAAWLPITDLNPVFSRYARDLGIQATTFETCIARENTEIERQNRLFQTFGISQVPTLFIGNEQFVGVQTVADLNAAVTAATRP